MKKKSKYPRDKVVKIHEIFYAGLVVAPPIKADPSADSMNTLTRSRAQWI